VKRILPLVCLIACALAAQAQVTFQFGATLTATNEVPPNDDPTVGTGTFLLTGNTLGFLVRVPAVTFITSAGYIQGPALLGSNAPMLFDLGAPIPQGGAPEFGIPPSFVFGSAAGPPFSPGLLTLTDQQISDLENGLWYVNVTSDQMTNGQVRGQILFQTAGNLQFTTTLTGTNETIPNDSSHVGTGWFALEGNVLNYGVGLQGNNVFFPTSAGIFGPATNGQDAPLLFDLGNFLTSFNPFSITYGGGVFLTPQQIKELVSGHWYVNFFSTNYPNGEIRGPILIQPQATLSDSTLTNNSFQFTISQVANLNYMVQASTELTSSTWVSLATNTAPFTFTDTVTNGPQRFYRAVYIP
jgi:hypothetical protein